MTAVSSPLADDGAARHLKRGRRLPDIALPTTAGRRVSFGKLSGRAIVYCYPWTGRPGQPNPPGWDDIPGAHGSTPETEGFREHYAGFQALGVEVLGISTQDTGHQPLSRIRRAFSRFQSRFFSVSRLSCSFLPCARASFSLAMPRRLK